MGVGLWCGDKIVTSVKPAWYTAPVAKAIVAEQKRRGYASTSATHVLTFLGKLSPAVLLYAHKAGKLKDYDLWKLNGLDDWCLSVTWPKTKLVNWKEVEAKGHWRCYYRKSYDAQSRWFPFPEQRHSIFYDRVATHLFQHEGLRTLGSPYDLGQLLDFPLNRWKHVPRSSWIRILDCAMNARVCSVGAYALEEKIRLTLNAMKAPAWEPAFVDLLGDPCHPDSILPADFENSRHYHCFARSAEGDN